MGRTHIRSSVGSIDYVIQEIDKEYTELKWLSEKELKDRKLRKVQCPRCYKFMLLKDGKTPWLVKCPHCCDKNEKPILKWLYIMNPENEVFDECPECNQYGYISAINRKKYIEFTCKNCKQRFFILKKDAIIDKK